MQRSGHSLENVSLVVYALLILVYVVLVLVAVGVNASEVFPYIFYAPSTCRYMLT